MIDEFRRMHRRNQKWDGGAVTVADLKRAIVDVADFPRPGILFRDIAPLLRDHFAATLQALDALLTDAEWKSVDALAGIESRGFVLVRKQGKLPPPVVVAAYDLEYGSGILEMQPGAGRLLLIDDVLATGGTMKAAAELCQRAGYEITALAALIDLNLVKNFQWRNLRLRAAISY